MYQAPTSFTLMSTSSTSSSLRLLETSLPRVESGDSNYKFENHELFLWFPMKGIRVNVPSSDFIYLNVGVVDKQFPSSTRNVTTTSRIEGLELSSPLNLETPALKIGLYLPFTNQLHNTKVQEKQRFEMIFALNLFRFYILDSNFHCRANYNSNSHCRSNYKSNSHSRANYESNPHFRANWERGEAVGHGYFRGIGCFEILV
ncbi:hypothetical protein DVH24_039559 [Malus domestica]|uniref:Uncharacterized protein n=1 Tax=Malus domestica TaxID=3750 RepID=A0A498I174_MALDO|nr:hypothetical protein DVH24_039559 [Malus domestica]